MAEEKNPLSGQLNREQIQKLLNAQLGQLNQGKPGGSGGVEYDYGQGANQMAQTLAGQAGPEAAIARMIFDTQKRSYNPATRQFAGDELRSNLRGMIGQGGGSLGQDFMQASTPAPQQAPRSVGTGPGPFGGAMAPGNSAEALRAIRMRELEDAMRQAELTRNNDNRGFAQSREGRSQGAYEMLMRLLPKFMGRV